MKSYGTLCWIIGISGAGKTTVGSKLYYETRKKQDNVFFRIVNCKLKLNIFLIKKYSQ